MADKFCSLPGSAVSVLYHSEAHRRGRFSDSLLAEAPSCSGSQATGHELSPSGSNIPVQVVRADANHHDWLSLDLDDALKPFLREPMEAWFSSLADAFNSENSTATTLVDREDSLDSLLQTVPQVSSSSVARKRGRHLLMRCFCRPSIHWVSVDRELNPPVRQILPWGARENITARTSSRPSVSAVTGIESEGDMGTRSRW